MTNTNGDGYDLLGKLLDEPVRQRQPRFAWLSKMWGRSSNWALPYIETTVLWAEREFMAIMGVLCLTVLLLVNIIFWGWSFWWLAAYCLFVGSWLGGLLLYRNRANVQVQPGRPTSTGTTVRRTVQFQLPYMDWRDLALPMAVSIIAAIAIIYLHIRFSLSLWLLVVALLLFVVILWRETIITWRTARKAQGQRSVMWYVSMGVLPLLILRSQYISLDPQWSDGVRSGYFTLAIIMGLIWVVLVHFMWPTRWHIDVLTRTRISTRKQVIVMANVVFAILLTGIMAGIITLANPRELMPITIWLMIIYLEIQFVIGNRPHPIQGPPEGEFILELPVAKRVAILPLTVFAAIELMLFAAGIASWFFITFPWPLVLSILDVVVMWFVYQWFRNHILSLNIIWLKIKVEMNGVNELFIEDRYLGEGRREGFDLPKLGNCEMGDPKSAFGSILAWIFGYGILRFGVIGDKARGELSLLTRGAKFPVTMPGGQVVWVYDSEAVLRWFLAVTDEANKRVRRREKK